MSTDHRELGREMRLFATSPLVGPGLPLWLPAGAAVRRELEQYANEVAVATGCEPVYSPVLGKRALYERSGHWAKFADDMFPPLDLGSPDPGDQLVLRPANCPHHAQVYASEQRSYRDLPVRLHELGSMFRAERSGVLSGLSRVRQITLDDTHVFCRPDQVQAEVRTALGAVLEVLGVLGLEADHLRLSARDGSDRWLGSPEQWEEAQGQLREALREVLGGAGAGAGQAGSSVPGPAVPWREVAGEAAFYGPKIDVQVIDAAGHEETLATVQVDFNQPERFDLDYTDADGEQRRVVMIHRGTVGSMERMVAFLLERHEGRLPFWLAPVQLCLLPLPGVGQQDDDAADPAVDPVAAAHAAVELLRRRGLRVRLEPDGSLGNRVRLARGRRDALLGVIGPAEAAAGLVAVTDPATGVRVTLPVADLVDRMSRARADRAHRVTLT
ncbi:threonine--tRNA ligase [Antribacter sp. KLBMP9083]|uniref:threonine--tRNA ligase n=1 Tax=Antribacter soli TaxID=2910976 RepID=A0AA41QE46_9MICO|nr:aminoacyl--tRNA ligase-related protein [Antribacter soli]MCF4121478.1 threonine--tRNA ligase [Antribacter soli]